MDRTLSYILPVCNAQQMLSAQVDELLDLLSELTPRFEILIVDEGSRDATEDVAHELAQAYPQVQVARVSADQTDDLCDHLGQLDGEIVFLSDCNARVDARQVRRLWEMRNDEQLVMARLPQGPAPVSPGLVKRLMSWGEALRDAGESTQLQSVRMLRRSAMMRLGRRQREMAMA